MKSDKKPLDKNIGKEGALNKGTTVGGDKAGTGTGGFNKGTGGKEGGVGGTINKQPAGGATTGGTAGWNKPTQTGLNKDDLTKKDKR